MDQSDNSDRETEIASIRAKRSASQSRHALALTTLMTEREDLRGVHALADLVADSPRWSA